jgi:hypothetical protein
MADYILLMHDDATAPVKVDAWGPYIAGLRAAGVFDGGSAIGPGVSMRKTGAAAAITASLGGYMRITADTLEEAQSRLAGNPVFEAGGTVEIRELPRTD